MPETFRVAHTRATSTREASLACAHDHGARLRSPRWLAGDCRCRARRRPPPGGRPWQTHRRHQHPQSPAPLPGRVSRQSRRCGPGRPPSPPPPPPAPAGPAGLGLGGGREKEAIQRRFEGSLSALLEAGIPPDPSLVFAARDNIEPGGREAAAAVLAAGRSCTAVLAATDLNAIGL